jgi:hypothetical protein
LRIHVEQVNQHGDFRRILFHASYEQVDELVVSDLTFLGLDELLVIVLVAVHLEHDEGVFSCHQKAFSVVLSHSLLCIVVNDDLFEEGLIELPIAMALMKVVIL